MICSRFNYNVDVCLYDFLVQIIQSPFLPPIFPSYIEPLFSTRYSVLSARCHIQNAPLSWNLPTSEISCWSNHPGIITDLQLPYGTLARTKRPYYVFLACLSSYDINRCARTEGNSTLDSTISQSSFSSATDELFDRSHTQSMWNASSITQKPTISRWSGGGI